tara:strand:- start:9059 stop:10207 length:1149 start_codon:yes stop_codon:yes gene_type:complete
MAYHFLFPEKDTTIYSHPSRQNLNTGVGEILELTTEKGINNELYYPSRILLQFKNSELTDVLSSKVTGSFSASLKLYATEFAQNFPTSQNIELYPLSESWDNGNQKYNENPTNNNIISNGCSWLYRDNETTKTSWGVLTPGTTGSFSGSTTPVSGGIWYTGSGFEKEQTLGIVNDLDLDFNVTSQIQKFSSSLFSAQTYPEGIPNNGFIILRENDVHNNTTDQGSLKYFSVDTNTIFSPTLSIKWDDSSYVTGSGATLLNSGKIQLNISNNKIYYKNSEEYTFRINVRKQFPTRTFTTSSNFLDVGYLSSTSYYSIEDFTSKEVIIPFDTSYTKLSADSEGMFFKLNMSGLQPERYYKILIRHDCNDGIILYDDYCYFKVER